MKRSAEILCIGTELLMGDIVNTNAAFIAKELTLLGIDVYHQTVVGDNPSRLKEAIALAISRSDILITTGGLGPTYDDLSKETLAGFFGRELVLHEPSYQKLKEQYEALGRKLTPNVIKQAYMPKGAIVLNNDNGTAPGCCIMQDGKLAFMMPGPPREMEEMFRCEIVPLLLKDSDHALFSHTMHFYGIGESDVEYRLHDLMEQSLNPTIAPYVKTAEVKLRITAQAKNKEEAEALILPIMEQIKGEIGEYLYGIDVEDMQTAAVSLLKEKKLTVATAESCTGGMIAERITQVSGASQVFQWGAVSYSNQVKQQLLGVTEETLRKYSAVSEETAREMAKGARARSGADIAVAVTGNAGPEPSEGKPVGLVYVAVESDRFSKVVKMESARKSDKDLRELIRHKAALQAFDLIIKATKCY